MKKKWFSKSFFLAVLFGSLVTMGYIRYINQHLLIYAKQMQEWLRSGHLPETLPVRIDVILYGVMLAILVVFLVSWKRWARVFFLIGVSFLAAFRTFQILWEERIFHGYYAIMWTFFSYLLWLLMEAGIYIWKWMRGFFASNDKGGHA